MVGTSGSGKTTFARDLASRLAVACIELDALVHGPGWIEASDGELVAKLEPLLTAPAGWVVDGNYDHKLGDSVLERADTLVWLDLPLGVTLPRLWWRTWGRIRRRQELWNGNRETWRNALLTRDSLFAWAIRSHFARRRTMPLRLRRPGLRHLRVERLRSPGQVERWLAAQEKRGAL